MSYYDALIAAWNSVQQPPPGVTGQPLAGTTAEKVVIVNAWKTTAAAEPMILPTYRIYNTIVLAEFDALTADQRQHVRDLLVLVQCDASPNTTARSMMLSTFPGGTQTRANMQALAAEFDTASVDWCFKNNYPTFGRDGPGNLSTADANNAGLV